MVKMENENLCEYCMQARQTRENSIESVWRLRLDFITINQDRGRDLGLVE